MMSRFLLAPLLTAVLAQPFFEDPPGGVRPFGTGYTRGAYPRDFNIVGSDMEAIHDSQSAPTGLAVDVCHRLYLTYPRNNGPTPNNVVICTSFNAEKPWPNDAMQNCTTGQDPSTCFINVQNIVRDDRGRLWVVDSGLAADASPEANATYGGAKIMSFNETTSEHIRTYKIPEDLLAYRMNMNDLRINTTVGGGEGWAFITDASTNSSLVAINLETGSGLRRLFNTSVVRADENYVGSYDGEAIYSWSGNRTRHLTIGADGIALASGNLYWGVLASRRFYFISQEKLIDDKLKDEQVLAAVQNPGQIASEQAGFTADDHGRVYIAASEQNAIYYVDTRVAEQYGTANDTEPGGNAPLPAKDYVVHTLLRNAMIQHADSMVVLDGYLWFNTNQLMLGPPFQYLNADKRKGPFRSYRYGLNSTTDGRNQAV